MSKPKSRQKLNKMKNVAVIGAGTMGNGIAHVFAMNGYKVSLVDFKNKKEIILFDIEKELVIEFSSYPRK